MPQELAQAPLEFRDRLLAGERLVETEGGEDQVGLVVEQVLVQRGEVVRAGHQVDLVRRPGKVAHDELLLREALVEERLEVAEMVGSIEQGVADVSDTRAGLDLEGQLGPGCLARPRLGRGVGEQRVAVEFAGGFGAPARAGRGGPGTGRAEQAKESDNEEGGCGELGDHGYENHTINTAGG